MATQKRDNGSPEKKLELRHKVAAQVGDRPLVLEGFIGEGRLWRAVWPMARGVALDRVEAKVRAAAMERPYCACYVGETERAIRHGLGRCTPFDVVDLDCYGSPWEFVAAWFGGERARAPLTHLLLTDTCATQVPLVGIPRVLAQDGEDRKQGWNTDRYFERAAAMVETWAAASGLVIEAFEVMSPMQGGRSMKVWQHWIRVRHG